MFSKYPANLDTSDGRLYNTNIIHTNTTLKYYRTMVSLLRKRRCLNSNNYRYSISISFPDPDFFISPDFLVIFLTRWGVP